MSSAVVRRAHQRQSRGSANANANANANVGDEDQGRLPSDVTVYGATGFVGRYVCEYLVDVAVAGCLPEGDDGQPLRVTVAGRNESKLRRVCETMREREQERARTAAANKAEEGPNSPSSSLLVDWFVADCDDPSALSEMAGRTVVVVNCAGPFAKYGTEVVRACANSGTDYVDITGEVEWAAEMRDRFGEAASKSGSRIVSMCGFDSVPSDLAVFAAVQAVRERCGDDNDDERPPCPDAAAADGGDDGGRRKNESTVKVREATTWHCCRGMLNGGTLHTALDIPVNWRRCLFDDHHGGKLRLVPYFVSDPFVLSRPALNNVDEKAKGGEKRQHAPEEEEISSAWTDAAAAEEWRNNLPSIDKDVGGGIVGDDGGGGGVVVSIPFFMAVANAKVVLASAASLDYGGRHRCEPKRGGEGEDNEGTYFTYRERFLPAGMGVSRALGILSAIPSLLFLAALSFTMAVFKMPVLGKRLAFLLLPPGSGSPDVVCRAGYADVYAEVRASASAPASTTATTDPSASPGGSSARREGEVVVGWCRLNFGGDPGNLVTAQCVSEAALCLVFDRDDLPPRTTDGFGTPARVFGRALLRRLKVNGVRPVGMETKVLSAM